MQKPSSELTRAEWTIIKMVWQKEPCTAPDIQEALHMQTGWTYSTVRTLMDRMAGKGVLVAEKTRNLTFYRSAVTKGQAQRTELLSAVKKAFNGAFTPMVQCLLETGELSSDELTEIESLIKAKRKAAKK